MTGECGYCGTTTWIELVAKNGKLQCKACRVERFYELTLFKPIGFRLLDWQRKVLRDLFGTVDPETGLRRYRRAYVSVAKKNGKSFLVGGLPLYHLLIESSEFAPKAFGCASSIEQASIVYAAAEQLVSGNPRLRERLTVLSSTKRIINRDTGGVYRVLSADGNIQDGIEPSLALLDELHRWTAPKARTLYSVIRKGTISRREPLTVEITTAGDEHESGLWFEEYEYAKQVAAGALKSDRFYAAIWSADEERLRSDPNYWLSKEARVAGNPSHEDLGGFLRDEALQDELEDALAKPGQRNNYIRLNLNVPAQSEEHAIDMIEWDQCKGDWTAEGWLPQARLDGQRGFSHEYMGRWMERRCYLGVDLSTTTDLSGLVLTFPKSDGFELMPFAWISQRALRKSKARDQLQKWIDAGFLELADGDVIDYGVIRQRINWAREMFDVQEAAFDPWNSRETTQILKDDGLLCLEVGWDFPQLTLPTKKLLDSVVDRKIQHGGHPVLRWNASCLAVKSDQKDRLMPVKPDRQKSAKRIDLMAAAILGISRAIFSDGPSVYANPETARM